MKPGGGWCISRRSEGQLSMAEDKPATSGRKRSGASYAHEWNRFVAWSEAAGIQALPATAKDVAAYLENRAQAGVRASTIKVAAAAIAHNHRDAGFDAPLQPGVARNVLEELTQDHSPGPVRALPLDLDCYLSIRKTAHEPRSGRGGGMERVTNARRRGALDVAMIGLMRDARAPGERGGRPHLGRLGAGSRRLWPGARGRHRLPRGERRHDEAAVVGPPGCGRERAAPGYETQPDSDTDRRGGETGRVGRRLLGGQSQAGDDPGPGDPRSASAGKSPRWKREVDVLSTVVTRPRFQGRTAPQPRRANAEGGRRISDTCLGTPQVAAADVVAHAFVCIRLIPSSVIIGIVKNDKSAIEGQLSGV